MGEEGKKKEWRKKRKKGITGNGKVGIYR